MAVKIGNVSCSRGIELITTRCIPEDLNVLASAFAECDFQIIDGVVFQTFHDPCGRAH